MSCTVICKCLQFSLFQIADYEKKISASNNRIRELRLNQTHKVWLFLSYVELIIYNSHMFMFIKRHMYCMLDGRDGLLIKFGLG